MAALGRRGLPGLTAVRQTLALPSNEARQSPGGDIPSGASAPEREKCITTYRGSSLSPAIRLIDGEREFRREIVSLHGEEFYAEFGRSEIFEVVEIRFPVFQLLQHQQIRPSCEKKRRIGTTAQCGSGKTPEAQVQPRLGIRQEPVFPVRRDISQDLSLGGHPAIVKRHDTARLQELVDVEEIQQRIVEGVPSVNECEIELDSLLQKRWQVPRASSLQGFSTAFGSRARR